MIRDVDLTGFGLRVPSGGASFIVESRVARKNKRLTIGRSDLFSVEDARKEAIKLLDKMTSGVDPAEEKQKQEAATVTLGEALDSYISSRRLRPNTIISYRQILNLCSFFSNYA